MVMRHRNLWTILPLLRLIMRATSRGRRLSCPQRRRTPNEFHHLNGSWRCACHELHMHDPNVRWRCACHEFHLHDFNVRWRCTCNEFHMHDLNGSWRCACHELHMHDACLLCLFVRALSGKADKTCQGKTWASCTVFCTMYIKTKI